MGREILRVLEGESLREIIEAQENQNRKIFYVPGQGGLHTLLITENSNESPGYYKIVEEYSVRLRSL